LAQVDRRVPARTLALRHGAELLFRKLRAAVEAVGRDPGQSGGAEVLRAEGRQFAKERQPFGILVLPRSPADSRIRGAHSVTTRRATSGSGDCCGSGYAFRSTTQ